MLDPAYDDALGVTAAFNRNVLLHLNKRFGFDFALDGYRHRAFYNEAEGRIEMHLESLRDQAVHVDGRARRFAAGERIHTENSYKYGADQFAGMLREAGFPIQHRWSAPSEAYFVFWVRVRSQSPGSEWGLRPLSPDSDSNQGSRARRRPENCQRASAGKKLR